MTDPIYKNIYRNTGRGNSMPYTIVGLYVIAILGTFLTIFFGIYTIIITITTRKKTYKGDDLKSEEQ